MDKLGLLGHDVHYSLSPHIFNVLSKLTGRNIQYDILDSKYIDYATLIKRLKSENYLGFNITIPYKHEILKHCETQSDLVKRVGAANTIIIKNGNFHAENTDVFGITKAIEEVGFEIKGKKILLLGAGGVARSSIIALADMGVAEIVIWNRTEERATNLIHEIQSKVGSCKLSVANKTWFFIDMSVKFDGLIHAMPYFEQKYDVGGGIGGFETDISGHVKSDGFIYDVVYRPLVTPLYEIADEHKIRYENGVSMLIHQAIKSWDIWTGQNVAKNLSYYEEIYKEIHSTLEKEGIRS